MEVLRGRSVVVTGADGFIGSHLVERLLTEGADVRALCYYTSEGSRGWLEALPAEQLAQVDVWLGDVRDHGFVHNLIDGCDTVFHLAALIAIPYSYLAPRAFVDTNIVGTQHVLDAVRGTGALMINTSTSEVYGTPAEVPIRETHPLQGQSPYAATKIAADKLCEAYARSFGTRVVTLRPFNTYGPRQSLRAVIPTVLAQLLGGAEEIHLGSLSPRRDFTYVDDTVEGFVRTATGDLEPGEVVQLGTGVAYSIAEVVEACQRVVGTSARIVTDEARLRPAASEVEVLLSDPSFAHRRLGWEARFGFEEGLARTADWLRDRGVHADVAARYHR